MKSSDLKFSRKSGQMLVLAMLCVATSFSIGIQSAGDVQPFTLIQAGSVQQRGDMNGDGAIDSVDATIILEIAQGYREPTVEQLKADPNQDGQLTVDDAMRIMSAL